MTAVLEPAPSSRRPSRSSQVVIRPAPRREPPFDDEIPDGIATPGKYDRHLPFARRPPAVVRPAEPVRRGTLPDPAAWSQRLLVGLIETAGGRRPLQQVAPLLSLSVWRGLGADFEQAARSGKRHWLHNAVLRTVRATEPAEGVAEMCATVETGRRVRAVAMRLEEHHGRWCCTRLQLG